MSLRLHSLLNAPVINLYRIDSTNNYAMQLIDADKAQPGMTIITHEQTQGKGQRGKHWKTAPGEGLAMSVICTPDYSLEEQFIFNAIVVVSIADVLNELGVGLIRIKWPNDIIINDKKAGGILIENIIRGSKWNCSVIGIGINVSQTSFPAELPFATSLKLATGKDFEIGSLAEKIRENILANTSLSPDKNLVMKKYNDYLYKKDLEQKFYDGSREWKAIIKGVENNGTLMVQDYNGMTQYYNHGAVQWKWE